jgi:hypothetical protein
MRTPTQYLTELWRTFESVPTYEPLNDTIPALLLKLDAPVGAGLSDLEFMKLFVKCGCGLLMTRRSFEGHTCAVPAIGVQPPVNVIDLTSDSDESVNGVIDLTHD